MSRIKKTLTIIGVVLGVVAVCAYIILFGYIYFRGGAPQYYVDSYDQIKQDLKGLPGLAYPDLSRYEGFAPAGPTSYTPYIVYVRPADRSIRDGYDVLYDNRGKPFDAAAGTVLAFVEVSATELENSSDDKESVPEGAVSMTYRGIVIYLYEAEDFWYQEADKLGNKPDDLYPSGTRAGSLNYVIDIGEYQYCINAGTILLPSEQASVTFEERMTQARNEVFTIIDSILDQTGASQ